MAAINAALVKEVRELTGLGMMDCKKALVDADGDRDRAIEILRTSSGVKAAKKADRTASDGLVRVEISADGSSAVVVEVNCETDFAARHEDFQGFVSRVAAQVLASGETDVAKILESGMEDERQAIVQKIGENVSLRRAARVASEGGVIADYVHNGKIAVLVQLKGGDYELGRDVAMHVAATNPLVVVPEDLDEDSLAAEKKIFVAQAAESGKPPEIVEKMVAGRIRKYLTEVSLVNQPFVKNPDQTVGGLLASADASVVSFVRFEVGEGIEVVEEDFAAEVRKTTGGE